MKIGMDDNEETKEEHIKHRHIPDAANSVADTGIMFQPRAHVPHHTQLHQKHRQIDEQIPILDVGTPPIKYTETQTLGHPQLSEMNIDSMVEPLTFTEIYFHFLIPIWKQKKYRDKHSLDFSIGSTVMIINYFLDILLYILGLPGTIIWLIVKCYKLNSQPNIYLAISLLLESILLLVFYSLFPNISNTYGYKLLTNVYVVITIVTLFICLSICLLIEIEKLKYGIESMANFEYTLMVLLITDIDTEGTYKATLDTYVNIYKKVKKGKGKKQLIALLPDELLKLEEYKDKESVLKWIKTYFKNLQKRIEKAKETSGISKIELSTIVFHYYLASIIMILNVLFFIDSIIIKNNVNDASQWYIAIGVIVGNSVAGIAAVKKIAKFFISVWPIRKS